MSNVHSVEKTSARLNFLNMRIGMLKGTLQVVGWIDILALSVRAVICSLLKESATGRQVLTCLLYMV